MSAPAHRAGEVFAGRFEILAEVGRGGMSTVYQARDRLSGDLVALKVIQQSIAEDTQIVQKFKQELLLARRLTHRNVVRIHDIGEHKSLLFLTMEYVEGTTLAEQISSGKIYSPSEFVPVFQQLCQALAYVHSQNIVHRDIKPLNVMVTRDGVVKLMDFGISREVGIDQTIGMNVGTPAYMAPELMLGHPPTQESDVYAAGVMFHELLTGEKPGQLRPLPIQRLRCPSEIIAMVRRCLEPDPKLRFHSVAEMAKSVPGAALEEDEGRPLSSLLKPGPGDRDILSLLLLRTFERLSEIRHSGQRAAVLSPTVIRFGDDQIWIRVAEEGATIHLRELKYSSPEYFQETGALAEPSDVYITGFIFYELFAGSLAHDRQFASTCTDLAWSQWHGDASKTLAPLKSEIPGFPAGLSRLMGLLTAKSLAERPRTVDQALDEVRRVMPELAETEVMRVPDAGLRQPTNPPRTPSRGSRLSFLWALPVLLAILGVWWWFNRPPTPIVTSDVAVPVADKDDIAEIPPSSIQTRTGPMALVPEGSFTMGIDAAEAIPGYGFSNRTPARTVEVRAFYMDQFEVTNKFYAEFLRARNVVKPIAPKWDSGYLDKLDYPAMSVSYLDATAFCAWAGKRLPTEAEWEKAARGTDGRKYPWGNNLDLKRANWEGDADGHKYPAPVFAFAGDRSPYGIIGLAGNVPEWVSDVYSLYPGNTGTLPEAERSYIVVRGGGHTMTAAYGETTSRGAHPPELIRGFVPIGFRCAADVTALTKLQLKP